MAAMHRPPRPAGPACRVLLQLACACAAAVAGDAMAGRHAHWVLRTSNLNVSLAFYEAVFGLRVLRHEEHPQACPITCNGRYNTAWSKTMVGYDTEDQAYALELTYNYGVHEYRRGDALQAIALWLERPLLEALSAAGVLGFGPAESDGGSTELVGPDGYRYVLMPPAKGAGGGSAAAARPPPFDHVRLRVRDVEASIDFYMRFLGMEVHTEAALGRAEPSRRYVGTRAVVGYGPPARLGAGAPGAGAGEAARPQVPLFLEPSPSGAPVRVEEWEGRHAVTLPAAVLRAAYAALEAERPDAVVHSLREVQDKFGILLIAVVKDPNGLETCLVGAEVFDAAARAADDFVGPDWEFRASMESGAQAASRKPERPANWPEWTFVDAMKEHPESYEMASKLVHEVLEQHLSNDHGSVAAGGDQKEEL